jgi:hypothetical protein
MRALLIASATFKCPCPAELDKRLTRGRVMLSPRRSACRRRSLQMKKRHFAPKDVPVAVRCVIEGSVRKSFVAQPDITAKIQVAIRFKEIASLRSSPPRPIISLGANRQMSRSIQPE